MWVLLAAALFLKCAAGTLLIVAAWSLTLALLAVAAGCLTVERMVRFMMGARPRRRAERSRAHQRRRHEVSE